MYQHRSMVLLKLVYIVAALGAVSAFAVLWSWSNRSGAVLSASTDSLVSETNRVDAIYVRILSRTWLGVGVGVRIPVGVSVGGCVVVSSSLSCHPIATSDSNIFVDSATVCS